MANFLEGLSGILQDIGGVVDSGADIYGSLQQFKHQAVDVPVPVKTKPATYSDPVAVAPGGQGVPPTTLLLFGVGAVVVFLLLKKT